MPACRLLEADWCWGCPWAGRLCPRSACAGVLEAKPAATPQPARSPETALGVQPCWETPAFPELRVQVQFSGKQWPEESRAAGRAAIHQGRSECCGSVSLGDTALLELPELRQKGRECCTNTAVTTPGSAALLQAGDVLCIATLALGPLTRNVFQCL